MKTKTIYLEVPVSERLPEIMTSVPVILNLPSKRYDVLHVMKHNKKWFDYNNNITHWLEKKEDQITMSKEDFKSIAWDLFQHQSVKGIVQDYKDFEQYFNNLIK